MNPSTTLITALYDIGRDKLTGKNAYRPFTKYLNWFKHVLAINVPMVIFIPEELSSYVSEHRASDYSTKIIIRKFEELAAYRYHDRMQATINTMKKEHAVSYFKECPEFITAKYETIIFSKFDFLKEVSSENPFNTEYFIWLDAGTFYQEPPFNCKLEWPDPYKIRVLGNKFLISDYNFDIQDKTPLSDKKSYLRLNRNEICAFILGGTKIAIDRVHEQFWNEVNLALNMGVINNEQHFLQLMALEHPEYYYPWYRTRYQYPSLPVPLLDRMIPVELAVGTFMREDYAINKNVKLLTIATREIPDQLYSKWKSTAKHYGYDYEILGRDQPWRGWNTKVRLFHDRLQTVDAPYVALTDSTDVFFCGCSDELYDKIVAQNKNLIMGGELQMYYPGGKHDRTKIEKFFESIKESPQLYPNAGFIMGKTEEVRKLMGLHLEYSDDQTACFDTIYEGKLPLYIDYNTEIIANVANYRDDPTKSTKYFEYDTNIGRYKNVTTNTVPVVFHFPGKFEVIHDFYLRSQAGLENITNSNSNSNSNYVLGLIIVLIILASIVIFSYYWIN